MICSRICTVRASLFPQTHFRSLCLTSNTRNKGDGYDIAIVGGGIVGLATARELILRWPKKSFILLEKEPELAVHQSGHNSGVIHAGIYYTPGSLKAKLCVEGLRRTYVYCDQKKIPYKKCGKLIVALDEVEKSRLDDIYQRGLKNEVPGLRYLHTPEEVMEIEPNCTGGIAAIHSPATGIIDWQLVARSYGEDFLQAGGTVVKGFQVSSFQSSSADSKYPITLVGSKSGQSVSCQHVVTCAGLFSDRMAQLSGCAPEPRIVPFRGDYLVLPAEKSDIVRGNIYPVPDPRFPFLGVHFTPRVDGSVWLGPNAILAFKREGYGLFDVNFGDLFDALGHSGLRKLVWKHLGFGMKEIYKVLDVSGQIKELQRYVPSLNPKDVKRGPSGVRAQALDTSGNLVDDFVFDSGPGEVGSRVLHVRNAPSPAATSSLAIGRMVADQCIERFGLPAAPPSTP